MKMIFEKILVFTFFILFCACGKDSTENQMESGTQELSESEQADDAVDKTSDSVENLETFDSNEIARGSVEEVIDASVQFDQQIISSFNLADKYHLVPKNKSSIKKREFGKAPVCLLVEEEAEKYLLVSKGLAPKPKGFEKKEVMSLKAKILDDSQKDKKKEKKHPIRQGLLLKKVRRVIDGNYSIDSLSCKEDKFPQVNIEGIYDYPVKGIEERVLRKEQRISSEKITDIFDITKVNYNSIIKNETEEIIIFDRHIIKSLRVKHNLNNDQENNQAAFIDDKDLRVEKIKKSSFLIQTKEDSPLSIEIKRNIENKKILSKKINGLVIVKRLSMDKKFDIRKKIQKEVSKDSETDHKKQLKDSIDEQKVNQIDIDANKGRAEVNLENITQILKEGSCLVDSGKMTLHYFEVGSDTATKTYVWNISGGLVKNDQGEEVDLLLSCSLEEIASI